MRVEDAHPAIVSEQAHFQKRRQESAGTPAPPRRLNPRRVPPVTYLLSGLVRCETCVQARPDRRQEAKSGQVHLLHLPFPAQAGQAEPAIHSQAQCKAASRSSSSMKIRENVLTESNITGPGEAAGRGDGRGGPPSSGKRLENIEEELEDVKKRSWAVSGRSSRPPTSR